MPASRHGVRNTAKKRRIHWSAVQSEKAMHFENNLRSQVDRLELSNLRPSEKLMQNPIGSAPSANQWTMREDNIADKKG